MVQALLQTSQIGAPTTPFTTLRGRDVGDRDRGDPILEKSIDNTSHLARVPAQRNSCCSEDGRKNLFSSAFSMRIGILETGLCGRDPRQGGPTFVAQGRLRPWVRRYSSLCDPQRVVAQGKDLNLAARVHFHGLETNPSTMLGLAWKRPDCSEVGPPIHLGESPRP